MARTAIIINNIFLAISAGGVCIHVWFDKDLITIWDGWLSIILQIVIIGTAVIADVASIGRTISIERDWIVVICGDVESLTSQCNYVLILILSIFCSGEGKCLWVRQKSDNTDNKL